MSRSGSVFRRKGPFIVLGILVLCIAAAMIGVHWKTHDAKTVIFASDYESGGMTYTLSVYMLGEPEFPYGSTRGLLELTREGERTAAEEFSVQNDGANLSAEDFGISWEEDGVRVTIHASEQEDCVIELPFDGHTQG